MNEPVTPSAAAIMAHDLAPAPTAGLRVSLVGDAHLAYADLNDRDHAALAQAVDDTPVVALDGV